MRIITVDMPVARIQMGMAVMTVLPDVPVEKWLSTEGMILFVLNLPDDHGHFIDLHFHGLSNVDRPRVGIYLVPTGWVDEVVAALRDFPNELAWMGRDAPPTAFELGYVMSTHRTRSGLYYNEVLARRGAR